MALRKKSLFLYGFEVTAHNRSIDFKTSLIDDERMATLTVGVYSLSSLLTEVTRAMQEVDTTNTYTVTADRSVNDGTENRVTIATSGSFLSILWSSGTRAASSARTLLGFPASDSTGSTTYTGTSTAGTALIPEEVGFSYLSETMNRRVFGSVNLSASGEKEAIIFQLQRFFEVEYKYEPEMKVITEWNDFMTWSIRQRPFDFTPEITSPNTFYDVTMETTSADGKALAFRMQEMLPSFPFFYRTGNLKMRIRES